MIVFVGSAPVLWMSRRQGVVETSTYGAEFYALRTATKEAIAVRHMLRSLGVPLPKGGPTKIFSDNLGVAQSASNSESLLKKKHTALSFHSVREASAANFTHHTGPSYSR